MENKLSRVRGYRSSSSYTQLHDEEEEKENLLGRDTFVLGNLHPKKRGDWSPSKSPKDQTIECDIQPSDTLKTLSLKYNIPISELKRVNNIINEAEFYALKRLKIPVKPTSFLTDLLPDVHKEERRNNNGWFLESKESPQLASSGLSSHVSSGYSSPCSETEADPSNQLIFHDSKNTKKVRKFLKDMDKDLDRIKERQSEIVTNTGDLPNGVEVRKYPLKATQIPTEDPGCSNRTLGCWCFLIGILIIIVFCVLVGLMKIEHDKEELVQTSQRT